ncbi:uncharacterized protein LOC128327421 [Hemicordylus capensis]|uniref:uncharacterized protein LOC128327421 n=1 Tax=Hemicordylus capensis TaxID=884348 RepID=UPI002303F5FC|nr:uncharacterized protein LOC128327421 [Hemicordylus capensis]
MGTVNGKLGTNSKTTPLQCLLDHFKQFKPKSSEKLTKRQLINLCQIVWPTYFLGQDLPRWPPEGALDVRINYLSIYLSLNFKDKEWPYMEMFLSLSTRPDLCEGCKAGSLPPPNPALVTKSMGSQIHPVVKKPVPQEAAASVFPVTPPAPSIRKVEEEDDYPYDRLSPPPPYPTAPPAVRPGEPSQGPSGMLSPGSLARQTIQFVQQVMGMSPTRDSGGQPSTPSGASTLSGTGTSPGSLETSGSSPQGAITPPEEEESDDSDAGDTAGSTPQRPVRTTRGRQPQGLGAVQCPLRAVPMGQRLVLVHTPFSTSDLHNWRQGLPPYRESPQKYVDLVGQIISTHRPHIPDLFTLLTGLLSEDELRQVLKEAHASYAAWRGEQVAQGRYDAGNLPEPLALISPNPPEPATDPNNELGNVLIMAARTAVLDGLRKGVPKAINFHRVYEAIQGPQESPTEFLVRLKDAFRSFTDLDPEAPGNEAAIKTAFIGQSAPDIRKKLQKLTAPSAQPMETLIQTAFQVFHQRGEVEEKFLVDTGATYSVLAGHRDTVPALTTFTTPVVGIGGEPSQAPVTQPVPITPSVKHSFLVLPKCPLNLLGRDLLCKLRADIHCRPEGLSLSFPPETAYICYLEPTLGTEPAEWREVDPEVWYTGTPGLAKYATPHQVPLKPGACPISVRQYPLKREARIGLQPIIQAFLEADLLMPVSSPWCTPILPVPKSDGSWRFVQDLREVNARTLRLHPMVANPHTILTTLTRDQTWYVVVDLKDAFFCVPLAQESQPIFAFEWLDPDGPISHKNQFSWKRIPQGYSNSPSAFQRALSADLSHFQPPAVTILQYVDDLLVAAKTADEASAQSVALLNHLGSCGYKVSKSKIQWVSQKVRYLGYVLEKGTRYLHPSRIQALNDLNPPQNVQELRSFLGIAGYGRLWVPGFSVLSKPLYELTALNMAWEWTGTHQRAWEAIRSALASAAALALPDRTLPFELFVHEKQGVALAVLTQTVGPARMPVAYFSKNLDSPVKGWPACLRAIAAAATMVEEALKISAGSPIHVQSPHSVAALLDQKLPAWATSARLTRYVSILLENDSVSLHKSNCLNPATLLPLPAVTPVHDCLRVLAETVGIRPDLRMEPIVDPDLSLWTDGSSFVLNGQRYTGYAVVTEEHPVILKRLPPQCSAQVAELEALIAAATYCQGIRANIYTDSRYSFLAAHTHASLWKARGFRGADGKTLKMKPLLERLFSALLLPSEIAVIHCRGHQTDDGPVTRGNRLADTCARHAAQMEREEVRGLHPAWEPKGTACVGALIPVTPTQMPSIYDARDHLSPDGKWVNGWWVVNGRIQLPSALVPHVIKNMHTSTHLGARTLYRWLKQRYSNKGLRQACRNASKTCPICQRNNPKTGVPVPRGRLRTARYPGEAWQVDFTEMPKQGTKHNHLVFVDLFSGWPEVFPTRTQTAREVVMALVESIIPRFSVPRGLESDNGPHFTSKVVQEVCKLLDIPWFLHSAYHPESSAKVERMNQSLKINIAKLCQETNLKWPKVLPLALTRVRAAPSSRLGLSPFELVYGRPFVASELMDPPETTQAYLRKLVGDLSALSLQVSAALPVRPDLPTTVHPGDWVLVKELHPNCTEPKWSEPKQVLLSTPTAARVEGLKAWVHISRLKPVPAPADEWACEQLGPLRLKIQRHTQSSPPPRSQEAAVLHTGRTVPVHTDLPADPDEQLDFVYIGDGKFIDVTDVDGC